MAPPIEDWFGFVEGSEGMTGKKLEGLVAADPRVRALTSYFSRVSLDAIPHVKDLNYCLFCFAVSAYFLLCCMSLLFAWLYELTFCFAV